MEISLHLKNKRWSNNYQGRTLQPITLSLNIQITPMHENSFLTHFHSTHLL